MSKAVQPSTPLRRGRLRAEALTRYGTGQMLRFLTRAVAFLLVVGGVPAAEAQKRSATLSVRVMVVRSCSVSTGTAPSGGNAGSPSANVTCESKSGPPPRTTSGAVPFTAFAAAGQTAADPLVDTLAALPLTAANQSQTARQDEPAPGSEAAGVPAAGTAAESDRRSTPAQSAAAPSREMDLIRVMTVNF